jgi:hypothetical protein
MREMREKAVIVKSLMWLAVLRNGEGRKGENCPSAAACVAGVSQPVITSLR